MIRLDDHRKANLEMMFQHATDRDLIHELLRRGRLRQIQARTAFWGEMRDESGYMDVITHQLMARVAQGLDTDKSILKSESVVGHPPAGLSITSSKQTILTADVIVLRAREKSGE